MIGWLCNGQRSRECRADGGVGEFSRELCALALTNEYERGSQCSVSRYSFCAPLSFFFSSRLLAEHLREKKKITALGIRARSVSLDFRYV